jgi:hypothetical protein
MEVFLGFFKKAKKSPKTLLFFAGFFLKKPLDG